MEDAAAKIHSQTHLLQMAQEKKQMELSHKRARIELEKAAHSSARDFEREVDRNQDLLTRIKKLEEREAETAQVLNEQTEMNKALRKTMEGQNKKLEEKDSKISNTNEAICTLRDEIRELNHKIKNQEIQLATQATENESLQEQVEYQRRETKENSSLLKEESEGLRRKLERLEKIKEDMVNLELEKEPALEGLSSCPRLPSQPLPGNAGF
ncbi:hypothetical protein JZ751_026176 [Albula glossodonta]|uniref:Uncharacterized protein n=1 Tax=Albula glossodonta TaxID=121402 RepID=A0A8T2P8P4_9TELE|nr:hypothetical protein JZ751_026176 [Albula glossodonta]